MKLSPTNFGVVKMKVKILSYIIIIVLSSSVYAGFWSSVEEGAKSVVGYVYDVGAAIVSPITNWLGEGQRRSRSFTSTGYSQQSVNSGIDSSILDRRISAINGRLSAIDNALSNMRAEIRRVERELGRRISANEAKIREHDLRLEKQAKKIERNRLSIAKNSIEDLIIGEAREVFSKDVKSVKLFIRSIMEKVKKEKDPELYEHYIFLMNKVIFSALENSQKLVEKDGASLFPIKYKKEMLDIANYYKSEVLNLPFSPEDKGFLNKYIDELQYAIYDKEKIVYEQANRDWEILSNQEVGTFNLQLSSSILQEKGSHSIRETYQKIQELRNSKEFDNNIMMYQRIFTSQVKELPLTDEERQVLLNTVSHILKEQASLMLESRDNFQKKINKISKSKEEYERMILQRDIIEPCLHYLSKSHPASLKKYFDAQFELTLYKIAWAYRDSNGMSGKSFEESISNLDQIIRDAGIETLVEEKSHENYEKNITLQELIDFQSKKYKSSGKVSKFLLNERDQYALSRAKQFDESDYLRSILHLIHESYTTDYQAKTPISAIESRIEHLKNQAQKYDVALTSLINTIPSCKTISNDISLCYSTHKDVSFSELVRTIKGFENAFLSKLENSNLPSLGDLEIKISLYEDKKKTMKKCESISGKVTSSGYGIVYKDIDMHNYNLILQPGDAIYIDYKRKSNKGNIPILGKDRSPLGWIKESDTDFLEKCLNAADELSILSFD